MRNPIWRSQHRGERSVIFGRERERALLHDLYDKAAAGHGSLVLISGEAGIGKTTLATDFTLWLGSQQATILTGYCYDHSVNEAYSLWSDLFDRYGQEDQPHPVPSSFAGMVASQPFESRQELYLDVRQFLETLAEQQLLVLVLEDIHWSDPDSLDLLRHLSHRLDTLPMLVLATYRDHELSPEHSLHRVLPNLIREAPTRRVRLHRLAGSAVRELVDARYSLSDSDTVRLTRYLTHHAEGNPFFIDELVHSLEDERALQHSNDQWTLSDLDVLVVPPIVRQVIDARLRRLDDEFQRLLDIAAVIGQEVPLDLWNEVSIADDETLIDVIEQAHVMNVLHELPEGDGYRFSHALVQEALYDGIVLPRRQLIHRTIAETLMNRPVQTQETIAHHLQMARDPRAVEWLIRAGEGSLERHAPESAITHLDRALELAEEFSIIPPARILHLRGRAYDSIGAFDQALADYEAVQRQALSDGNQQLEWQTLLDLGLLWASRDYERSGEYCRRALEHAREMDDPIVLGHSLNRFGNWHLNLEQPDVALSLHHEALEIFTKLEDDEGIGASLEMIQGAYSLLPDGDASLLYAQKAIPYLERANDRRTLSTKLAHCIRCAGFCSLFNRAGIRLPPLPERFGSDPLVLVENQLQVTQDIGYRSGEIQMLITVAFAGASRGEIQKAEEAGIEALALAEDIGHQQWGIFASVALGDLHLGVFSLDAAQRFFSHAYELAQAIKSRIWQRDTAAYLASAYIAAGDLELAQSLLVDYVDRSHQPTTKALHNCWYAQAELELALEQPGRALELVDVLVASAPDSRSPLSPDLRCLRAQTLLALDRRDEAEAELQAAHETASELGLLTILWRIEARLSQIYQHRQDVDEASRVAASTVAHIDGIAATIPDIDVRENFRKQALSRLPHAVRPARTRQTHEREPDELTPRELDVIRLIAEGLTDAEAAEQLHVSPRTVSTHLRSIYSKFDVRSRTAAAKIATDRGLV